jgi:predicted lipoprotein with Yx(FWY)xxD motif
MLCGDDLEMNYRLVAPSIIALAVFSACSGGGGGSGYGSTPVVQQTIAPTTQSLSMSSFTTPNSGRGTQSGFAVATGFAVYDFDLDLNPPAGVPLGTSACNGPAAGSTQACATFWPPVPAPAGVTLTAPFGVSRRLDGTLQLTYNGHPLYTYSQDTTAGVASGDGLNVSGGNWHLAQTTAGSSLNTVLATPIESATPAPSATVY